MEALMKGFIYPGPLSSMTFRAVKEAVAESKKKKDGKMCKRIKDAVVATVVSYFTVIS